MCKDKRTIPLSTSQATPLHVLVVASLWTRVVLPRHGHISEDAQQQRLLGNFFCQKSHTRNCLVSGVSFCLDSWTVSHMKKTSHHSTCSSVLLQIIANSSEVCRPVTLCFLL